MRKQTLNVKLYERDYTTLIEDITQRIGGRFLFSTQLNGGFGQFRFDLTMPLEEAWEWYHHRLNYHVVIREGPDKVIWEGRTEDVDLVGQGIEVTCLGYWANCFDQCSDAPSYGVGATAWDVADALLTAKCSQISAVRTYMTDPGFALGGLGFEDEYTGDIITQVLGYSDVALNKWYFAIWEDRLPYMFPRPTTTVVDWQVWRRNLEPGSARLRRSLSRLWNRTYGVYTQGAGGRTIDYDDTDSQAEYGLTRTRAVFCRDVLVAIADNAAQAALQEGKRLQQASPFVITDKVYDAHNQAWPLWRVRAGDTIRIADLVPVSGSLAAPELDQLRTFYIVETSYDAQSGRLTITPDRPGSDLASILARAGIGVMVTA